MASEIIVSINVQSGKAEVGLGKAKVGVDKLAAAQKRLAEANADGAVKIAEINLQTKQQIQVNNQLAAEQLKNVNKSSGQFRTQVGLNNAILTEAGRAASDLRFGFNGVANNVGQIASLFGNLINTSDNVGTSLKNLAKSLIGTGGVMIAIQLLIAFGDQIYDFFAGIDRAAEDARKEVEQLTKSLNKQIAIINDLGESTLRYGAKGKLLLIDIKRLRNEFSEFETGYDNLTDSQKASEDELLELVKAYDELIKGKKKLLELETDLEQKRKIGEDAFGTVRKAQAAYQKQYDLILKLQVRFQAKEEGNNTKSSSAQIRVFKEKLLQLEKLEQRYREKSVNKDLQTNQEKIAQFQQNEFAKLDILEENFITRESLRLKNYIESVKNQKFSDKKKLELIADAEDKFTKEVEQAGKDRLEVEKQILLNSQLMRDVQARKDGEIGRKLQEKEEQIREAFDLRKVELLRNSLGDDAIYFDSRAALLKDDIDRQQKITDQFAQGTVERANAEVELFRLKDSLRQNDLNKEVAAIAEKTRVQQIYVGYVSGISGILKAVAGENEALQKTALVLEKGAAIAGIVVNASSSIAQSVANTGVANTAASALLSNPLTAIAGGLALARNKAALAKEVLMTKVSAGIGIASILATTLTSAKSPSGGAGGSSSGASVTAPSFNVVGASATNQLAQTVAGQVNAPLRAYVVGSDISDQQELDRSIISTAGIG
ncbi:MAG TPA: hypothetical protein DCW83_13215 [Saprospirales bacterium]|nr:hypothetical protein [Saprospirales bacterium]